MSVTQKWLDQAKKAQRFTSDYQLAKAAGVSTQRLGNYRGDSNRGMDGDLAIKIAELAGVAPGVVLAELSAEKSKSDAERGAWLKVAAQMGRAAALCVILSVGLMALKPSPAMAFGDVAQATNIYIMRIYLAPASQPVGSSSHLESTMH